jgi:xanthine permease XanP
MARKPANLTYGVEDKPSTAVSFVLSLQHAVLLIGSVTASIFFGKEAGLANEQIQGLVTVALLGGGLTTFLQALPKSPVGSGYFCPHTSSFIYLQASVMAAKVGGLPLVFGMTSLAGGFEVFLSRFMRRLRPFFPAEVSGLVVTMVGISMAPYSIRSIVGLHGGEAALDPRVIFVGLATFSLMVGLNVWGNAFLRLYSIIIGVCFGYGAAYQLGLISTEQLRDINVHPLLALPNLVPFSLSFNASFLLPFLIASACASLKTMGDVVTCQKVNDADWKRPDIDSVSRGLAAEGLGTIATGLLGGLGQASNSSNIGLAFASGATSRWIGYFTGAIFISFAFLPKLVSALVVLPRPVIGAVTLFAACVMIVTGMSIIMSRMLDTRKIFIIGLSMILGVSVEAVPELYRGVPIDLKPIFGSTLALAVISAFTLNLIFRLGIASKAVLELPSGLRSGDEIYGFFETMGSAWGARREVVHRAMAAVNEFHETNASLNLSTGKVLITARFEEFNLDVEIAYQGKEMVFPQVRPSEEELLGDDSALARLSGFLITQMADRIKTEVKGDQYRILLHFDH